MVVMQLIGLCIALIGGLQFAGSFSADSGVLLACGLMLAVMADAAGALRTLVKRSTPAKKQYPPLPSSPPMVPEPSPKKGGQ